MGTTWKVELLGLLQWDSQDGGSHGGLVAAGRGPAMVGVESMRNWRDWATHYGYVGLAGLKGASRWFGKAVGRPGSVEVGGVVATEDGTTSVGAYAGGDVIGAGAYMTIGNC